MWKHGLRKGFGPWTLNRGVEAGKFFFSGSSNSRKKKKNNGQENGSSCCIFDV